ncbi:MAG TPA: histidine kinase [Usitatibacter sp.]|nr:histidine kinase [Usitatibacter sp.]
MSAAASPPARPDETWNPDHFHPLEIIPFFRRWKCGPVRDVIYTLIWNCGLGVAFWAIGAMFRPRGLELDDLAATVIVANVIGFTLHAMLMVTTRLGIDRWVRGYGQVATAAYYTVISTFGVVVGFTIVALAFDPQALRWILTPRWLAMMGLSSLVISAVLATVFFATMRRANAEAQLARERERMERAEREATLANLRALQAQIEPHFLFNTLANVTSLVDSDPGAAKRMLESFNRFLRASLAATRTESTTLGADAELIAAYLDVLQVRMGSRLAYRIDVPAELGAHTLPPMLLQPVVENAIRHGLEPKVEGGEVVVRARRDGASVCIEVADTGMGFAPTTRGGLGLSNLKDRLKALYGNGAELTIGENRPAGTVVTIALPA